MLEGPARGLAASRNYRAVIASATASAPRRRRQGPIAALTAMLHDREIAVETLKFHQLQSAGTPQPSGRGPTAPRPECAMGLSEDATQSGVACGDRLRQPIDGLTCARNSERAQNDRHAVHGNVIAYPGLNHRLPEIWTDPLKIRPGTVHRAAQRAQTAPLRVLRRARRRAQVHRDGVRQLEIKTIMHRLLRRYQSSSPAWL